MFIPLIESDADLRIQTQFQTFTNRGSEIPTHPWRLPPFRPLRSGLRDTF